MQKDSTGPVYAAGVEGLRAYWEILRPFNCTMAAAAAIIGLAIAGGLVPYATTIIFLAVFLVTGAGNAVNDYYDRGIDAVNRPAGPYRAAGSLPGQPPLLAGPLRSRMPSGGAGEQRLLASRCLQLGASLPLCQKPQGYAPGRKCVRRYLTGSTFLFGGAAAGTAGLLANCIPFALSF